MKQKWLLPNYSYLRYLNLNNTKGVTQADQA